MRLTLACTYLSDYMIWLFVRSGESTSISSGRKCRTPCPSRKPLSCLLPTTFQSRSPPSISQLSQTRLPLINGAIFPAFESYNTVWDIAAVVFSQDVCNCDYNCITTKATIPAFSRGTAHFKLSGRRRQICSLFMKRATGFMCSRLKELFRNRWRMPHYALSDLNQILLPKAFPWLMFWITVPSRERRQCLRIP